MRSLYASCLAAGSHATVTMKVAQCFVVSYLGTFRRSHVAARALCARTYVLSTRESNVITATFPPRAIAATRRRRRERFVSIAASFALAFPSCKSGHPPVLSVAAWSSAMVRHLLVQQPAAFAGPHGSTGAPIWELVKVTASSILEVVILSAVGYVLARRGIIDKKTQTKINKLNV